MFTNIGKKICVVAKVFFVLQCIGAFLIAIAAAVGVSILTYSYDVPLPVWTSAVIVLVLVPIGILFAWLTNICLYGFGQLISDTTEIKNLLNDAASEKPEPESEPKLPREEIVRRVKILKDRLNAGEITQDQYNKEIEKLRRMAP